MDMLQTLRNNPRLADLLEQLADVRVLQRLEAPEDEDGRLTWNIPGRVFARNGSGGEYLLLSDGSVAFHGSEGQGGRFADSLEDCFLFLVQLPYWADYITAWSWLAGHHLDILCTEADKIFRDLEKSFRQDGRDLRQIQAAVASGLGISLEQSRAGIVRLFFAAATREPRVYATFQEDDGSFTRDEGTLFPS